MTLNQIRRVNDYYDSTASDYREFWMGEQDLALHLGYYDAEVRSHAESLVKMNEVLAKLAGVSPEDRVLDAGCGYGGSAIWLAKNIGCDVQGVNVVLGQLSAARRFAKERDASKKVHFSRQDYCATSFPDASFNVVWALESVIHTKTKGAFAMEAARLLKRGGRVMMSDAMLTRGGPFSSLDSTRLRKLREGQALSNFLTPPQYQALFINAGFGDVQFSDLTENVRQSLQRLGSLCRNALPEAKLKLEAGVLNRTRYGNIVASICADELFDSGVLRYLVITALRP